MNWSSEAGPLHALRIRGAASVADVARLSGGEDVEARLEGLVAADLASETGGYFVLTEAGRERDLDLTAAELGDRGETLAEIYDERFLPINVRFKQLAAAWQSSGEDIELIEEAAAVQEEIDPLLARAAACAPHLDRYRERLGAAIGRFLDGDREALTGADGDSYHGTWFELHEDLIATLGRSREKEEA